MQCVSTGRGGLVCLAAAVVPLLPSPASGCDRCDRFDFLCCNTPADNRYDLMSFSGEGMACGGTADGPWYYATSWVLVPMEGGCSVAPGARAPRLGRLSLFLSSVLG